MMVISVNKNNYTIAIQNMHISYYKSYRLLSIFFFFFNKALLVGRVDELRVSFEFIKRNSSIVGKIDLLYMLMVFDAI